MIFYRYAREAANASSSLNKLLLLRLARLVTAEEQLAMKTKLDNYVWAGILPRCAHGSIAIPLVTLAISRSTNAFDSGHSDVIIQ